MSNVMRGFDKQWKTPEDFILGVTYQIWEGADVESLYQYYADEIPVRSPAGVVIGNEAVISATRATMAEFPDRELLGEDIIWCANPDGGFLSSHRLLSTATHVNDGAYGPATGMKLRYRIIADCAASDGVIYDEWLVRDQGAIVRQLGLHPKQYAQQQLDTAPTVPSPFPAGDVEAVYRGAGNNHPAGHRYAALLSDLAAGDSSSVEAGWDRGVNLELPGHQQAYGWSGITKAWAGLTTALPGAEFIVHHQVGHDAPQLGERASVRWSLTGRHDGPGLFGEPTGSPLHIMGISHAEFGPNGVRRDFTLYDETAIWTQILLGQRDKTR